MAYGNANVNANKLTWAAGDRPMILARNWMRQSTVAARWTDGTWATGDQSATGFGTARAYDDYDHLVTKPTSNAYLYYMIDLGAAVGEIDAVTLLNTNANTIGATVHVQFCDAQDNLYTPTTDAQEVTPAQDGRAVFLVLDEDTPTGTAQLFSDVRYLRIWFESGSAAPEIGEVILSQRVQLQHKSAMPYDPNRLSSSVGEFESASGIVSRYVRHKNRKGLSLSLNPHVTARISDIETMYETELSGGVLPFVWIDDPATSPQSANWMLMDPDLSGPLVGYTERQFSINAQEMGPNFLANE